MKRLRTKLEIYAYTYFLTLNHFARAVGLSYATMRHWIHKRAVPSVRTATKIEKFTNGEITVKYLREEMD